MEVEFVQGVRMGEKQARLVGELASRMGVRLTAHAPYFINLNAKEPEKMAASRQRLLQSARIGYLCGVRDVAFPAAFYMGDPPAKVYPIVKRQLEEVIAELMAEGNPVRLRPELTGKGSQFGDIEELLALSAEVEGVAPCIDFAHYHARTGGFNSYDEFAALLRQVEGRLGRRALEDMHIHLSGIHYGKQGEIKHLNLQESDLNYRELLQALKDLGAEGVVICESPNLEGDALLLQETYRALG